MIASALPLSVHAAGDLMTRTDTWAVTHDTHVQEIFPELPDGTTIKVTNTTHVIACHHLSSGKVVYFVKKKRNWYDSRKQPRLVKEFWYEDFASLTVNDWRKSTISRKDVIREVSRMGGGNNATAIVRLCC